VLTAGARAAEAFVLDALGPLLDAAVADPALREELAARPHRIAELVAAPPPAHPPSPVP